MIWIYHVLLLVVLNKEGKKDALSVVVLFSHTLAFLVHLRIYWVCSPERRNGVLIKYWYPCFFLVLTLVFLRYLTFYIKYSVIRNPIENLFGIKFQENFLTKSLFRDLDYTIVDNLVFKFKEEIILLIISIFTLTSLNKNDRLQYIEGKNDDKLAEVLLMQMSQSSSN